jgi:hypothetical protein
MPCINSFFMQSFGPATHMETTSTATSFLDTSVEGVPSKVPVAGRGTFEPSPASTSQSAALLAGAGLDLGRVKNLAPAKHATATMHTPTTARTIPMTTRNTDDSSWLRFVGLLSAMIAIPKGEPNCVALETPVPATVVQAEPGDAAGHRWILLLEESEMT